MEQAKFLRRVNINDYMGDQTVNITITAAPGSDSDIVENVPLQAGTAYEFEIEGKRVVFIGYETQS